MTPHEILEQKLAKCLEKYEIVIGLEVHAQLLTHTKAYSSDPNEYGSLPNTNVSVITLAHPGTLPKCNKKVLEYAIKMGVACGCDITEYNIFDRKNYFYPDLPKGYQLSQYDQPFCYDGWLEVEGEKVLITRIHLEEDTGKSVHMTNPDRTLLDFNRAGTPLMELVTEPTIKDAAQAKKFGQLYQQILRYLNISDADMEKGQMRCEANISVQEQGAWEYKDGLILATKKNHPLNAKVEVKNINSFRAMERAINFEVHRQTALLEKNEKIAAETRGWDENKSQTVSQRIKETAADYRYFPEPDIPPFRIDDTLLAKLQAELPELPNEKKMRFIREYGLQDKIAEIIVNDKALADWTEHVISELDAWIEANEDEANRQEKRLAKTATFWITGELYKHLNIDNKKISDLKMTAENFAELICLMYQDKITASAGQKILEKMYSDGGDPTDIMIEMGLEQMDNTAEMETIVKKIIADNAPQVEQYHAGKTSVFQFFVGQVMAATRGKANPKTVKELLEKFLK